MGQVLDFLSGCSSMVELQPSKLAMRVRFPSPAPAFAVGVDPAGKIFKFEIWGSKEKVDGKREI